MLEDKPCRPQTSRAMARPALSQALLPPVMSHSPEAADAATLNDIEANSDAEEAATTAIPLETAVTDRLATLTDALLSTKEVADHLLPLVKSHLVASADSVVPKAREHLAKLETVTYFTAVVKVLLSPPPPLTNLG